MRPMLESAQATLLRLSATAARAISAYSGFSSIAQAPATQLRCNDAGGARSRERIEDQIAGP